MRESWLWGVALSLVVAGCGEAPVAKDRATSPPPSVPSTDTAVNDKTEPAAEPGTKAIVLSVPGMT